MIIVGVILFVFGLLLLLTTILNVFFWQKVRNEHFDCEDTVSVLIPARNEAHNIIPSLETVVSQNNICEILIYNDHSTDNTAQLVKDFSKKYSNIKLLDPIGLPEGWTGKTFACYQLALQAKGNWLLFLDADARLADKAITGMLNRALSWKATLISCWPGLDMFTFWEKFLMPLLNFFVYTIYPAPISFKYDMPSLGIAHGACIMIKRDVYHKIGGHSRVRNKIFEDTELARLWRREDERSLCFDGQDVVRVRMYESMKDIWTGFKKNFYPGFNSALSFWLFMLFHFFLFLIPFFLFMYSPVILLMAFCVLIMRILLSIRFEHSLWSALLHPVGEIFLLMLGISSWWHFNRGKGVEWKGRIYLKENL